MSSAIESVLNETRVFPPPAECVAQANVSGMEAYRACVTTNCIPSAPSMPISAKEAMNPRTLAPPTSTPEEDAP